MKQTNEEKAKLSLLLPLNKSYREWYNASNIKDMLREISRQIGFAYDEKWNTRYFGKKLIEYINDKNK